MTEHRSHALHAAAAIIPTTQAEIPQAAIGIYSPNVHAETLAEALLTATHSLPQS